MHTHVRTSILMIFLKVFISTDKLSHTLIFKYIHTPSHVFKKYVGICAIAYRFSKGNKD